MLIEDHIFCVDLYAFASPICHVMIAAMVIDGGEALVGSFLYTSQGLRDLLTVY